MHSSSLWKYLAAGGGLIVVILLFQMEGFGTRDSDANPSLLLEKTQVIDSSTTASSGRRTASLESDAWALLMAASASPGKSDVTLSEVRPPSKQEIEEWKEDVSTDIGDTLTELVEECYEMTGIDKNSDGETELAFEVFGEPGVGTAVGSVELKDGGYGPRLAECVRESAYAVRASAPKTLLKDTWNLTIVQTGGRRVFVWGGEPIVVDAEDQFMNQ